MRGGRRLGWLVLVVALGVFAPQPRRPERCVVGQGLQVEVSPGGLTFGALSLSLVGEGRPRVDACEPSQATLAYTSGLREWVRGHARGLEHGFVVPARPTGPLELVFEVRGAPVRSDGEGRLRVGPVRYDDAHALDARGAAVPITLARRDARHFSLSVSPQALARAEFPLTIDPVFSPSALILAPTTQAGARFGEAVAGVGDVNGDGFDDLLVGAPGASTSFTGEGRAYLFLGGPSGLSTTAAWSVDPTDQSNAGFGARVAGPGDVNADGFTDVLVAAPLWDGAAADEGRVYLYLGSASGLGATPALVLDPTDQAGARFGEGLAGAGDVDGDGRGDVVVGAPGWDGAAVDEGRAWLFPGTTAGLSPVASWSLEPTDQANARFGASVAGVGDVDGDGLGDLGVGAPGRNDNQPGEGRVYVYRGASPAPALVTSWEAAPADTSGANFGASLSGAGDVDGDGFADLVVGAPNRSGTHVGEGRSFVFLGSSTGLRATASVVSEPTDVASAQHGASVAGAGDLNGDGYADLLVGAPGWTQGTPGEGRLDVYLGSAAGPAASGTSVFTSSPASANGALGTSVSAGFDVDGDGFGDFVVGAPGSAGAGRVEVRLGGAAGPSATPGWVSDLTDNASARFGYVTTAAGDVNGDGYGDLLVTAARYTVTSGRADEGRAYVFAGGPSGLGATPLWFLDPTDQSGANFGRAGAGVGDVDGDGYEDLAVGAKFWNGTRNGEGRVDFFRGGPSGPPATPTLTLEPTDQNGAYFGSAVAPAGDVNGDGYADVLVTAEFFDGTATDEGRAYVFHGSPTGLTATAAWVAEPTAQASAQFGVSAWTAGDVNGDGYSDVVVGAPYWDGQASNEGRAYLYLGSAAGLSMTPSWVADPSDQADARFGLTVSTAGDVNADGYADVLVAAPYYDAQQANEGRVYLYLGGAGGLSPTPALVFDPTDNAGALFGYSFGAAGDVDGDGFGDVVIGASDWSGQAANEGRAFIFPGAPGGLLTTPLVQLDPTDQVQAYFGNASGGAGDLNGDGFADVAIGAPLWDGEQADEGRAIVLYGGDGLPGRPLGLAQASGAVRPPGVATTTLQLGARAPVTQLGPLGGKLRLHVQLARPGIAPGAAASSMVLSAPSRAGVPVSVSTAGLTAGAWQWRARVLQPVGLGASRWVSFGGPEQVVPDFWLLQLDGGVDAGLDAGAPDAGLGDAGLDAGVDAGAVADGGAADAGLDAGLEDAGLDAGLDAGAEVDAGAADAGLDAGLEDAGVDAGVADAGADDAGAPDDAGVTDAGAGVEDAGPPGPPKAYVVGCGCQALGSEGLLAAALGLLAWARRRR